MCELNFERVWRYRRYPTPDGFEYSRKPNEEAVMSYNQWSNEIIINSHYNIEQLEKQFMFIRENLEDYAEAILTHESIHKALRNTVGMFASKKFDRICLYWALPYFMNPP